MKIERSKIAKFVEIAMRNILELQEYVENYCNTELFRWEVSCKDEQLSVVLEAAMYTDEQAEKDTFETEFTLTVGAHSDLWIDIIETFEAEVSDFKYKIINAFDEMEIERRMDEGEEFDC